MKRGNPRLVVLVMTPLTLGAAACSSDNGTAPDRRDDGGVPDDAPMPDDGGVPDDDGVPDDAATPDDGGVPQPCTDEWLRGCCERVGRGLVCLPDGTSVYCGWRLLPDDPPGIGFNLYRARSAEGPFTERVNPLPIRDSTNWADTDVVDGETYWYIVRCEGDSGAEGSGSRPSAVTAGSPRNHVDIGLQAPVAILRAVPGDLNGDGVLDFAVLTDPAPGAVSLHVEGLLSEAGSWTSRWRVATNLPDVRDVPFAVWDLDGDLKAEIIVRYGLNGSQLAVLDGETGNVRATTAGRPVFSPADWLLMVVGRIRDVNGDGIADPFVIVQQGFYVEPIHFYEYRFLGDDGGLVQTNSLGFDGTGHNYGFGTHGLVAADIDNDGKDEVLACGLAIEDDFTVKWIASERHNDTCFVADLVPSLPGVEVFMGTEGGERLTRVVMGENGMPVSSHWPKEGQITHGETYTDGAGNPISCSHRDECLYGHGLYPADCIGGYCVCAAYWDWERGWCAQLDAGPDWECFELEHYEYGPPSCQGVRVHLFSADGARDDVDTAAVNSWPVDWAEGEGISELYAFCNAPGVFGCSWYSGWPGDVLGDSREEAVVYNSGLLRIFTNIALREARYVTPLADRGYRASIARTGVGYSTNWIPGRFNRLDE